MDILDDRLKVLHFERDEKGDKVEPEQQPAQRTLVIGNELQSQTGQKLGTLDTSVQIEMPAGQMAEGFRAQCWACKHFNQRAWIRLFQTMSQTKDGMIMLNRFRAFLIGSKNVAIQNAHEGQDGDIDVEHALMACGICEPMSEASKEPVIVYPQAWCPETIPETNPPIEFGDHFVPKDPDAEKFGSMSFDAVMKKALGRR